MPAATWAVGGRPGRQLVQPGDARTLSTLPLAYLDVASPRWVARRIGLVACPAPDTFGSADTWSLWAGAGVKSAGTPSSWRPLVSVIFRASDSSTSARWVCRRARRVRTPDRYARSRCRRRLSRRRADLPGTEGLL